MRWTPTTLPRSSAPCLQVPLPVTVITHRRWRRSTASGAERPRGSGGGLVRSPEKAGILARMETKLGKEDEVASFLERALPLVQQEPDTVTWYVIRIQPC